MYFNLVIQLIGLASLDCEKVIDFCSKLTSLIAILHFSVAILKLSSGGNVIKVNSK